MGKKPAPAGWMLEQASDYILAAQLLAAMPNMIPISQINAALGVEILLKSFLAKPSGNHGQANESYKINNQALKQSEEKLKASGKLTQEARASAHDLLLLLNAIPEAVQQAAGLAKHSETIERHRNTFTVSRYGYEKEAPKGFSTTLLGHAVEMLYSTIEYARTAGSADPVVRLFPNGRAAPTLYV